MNKFHPRYRKAKQEIRELIRIHPCLVDQTLRLKKDWAIALEKDATGLQCAHLVDDLAERLQPMKW